VEVPEAFFVARTSHPQDGQATGEVVMVISIPDMPPRMTEGLCAPENPIVLAQVETW